ncbi:[protein-PII] uridylyltransferase [Halofilum ochraceum]|uniref:[protein-PII] uridylyltransferase n=1 Tax=Halofilum ochraceum TaxID=1611323 RepID=UPI000A44844C|nr:[protein-PII] uridylyltransferase [Halofilum ochraceum]
MAAPEPVPDAARFDTARIDAELRAGQRPAAVYAEGLAAVDAALDRALDAGTPAQDVVAARAAAVDDLLAHTWHASFGDANGDIALVAVGGYGRGELHPHSDVDLLILLADDAEDRHREAIEAFVTLLWDIGLEIGQAVRTVAQCSEAAREDVTTATNLMESRLLAGGSALYESMQDATGPERVWPTETFFLAKLDEQKARHRKFDRTAYRLEPNIKEGPGGLRDIQMVGWVAKRHFGAQTLAELVDHGFLTDDEYHRLVRGQELLWAIRWRLHRMTGRSEDRLLFDHQRDLAVAFGETADDPNRAVEAFMQRYYRAVMELQRLNEILLQFFREAILEPSGQPVVRRLNDRFRIRGETLEIAAPDVFRRQPRALIEMYLLLARHPEVRGVRAETLRRLRDDLDGIDDSVRSDPEARRLFMELLRQPWRVASQLFRMNRYGVLGAYIPAFDRIVGRMQYDLFHTYTVDEHTLRVIRNLREFRAPEEGEGDEFPLCLELMADLEEPELLYVAALFHDIAKGRDGDHSELGAVDAEAFCRDHGLSSVQTGLVCWLVRHHLLMSMTAQRRDLSDPAVIHEFARTVSSVSHLNHLYLLTVADIRATNPTLWNSWKDNLLRELYHKTVQALWRGLDNPIDKEERIAEVQHHARRQLAAWALDVEQIDALWAELGDAYFLRHNADEIVWHTRGLLEHGDREDALILLRRETQRGSTELFISRPDHRYRFALVTTVLDRLGLSIVDARVLTSRSGRALDTYLILEASGEPITDEYRIADIRAGLEAGLADPERLPDQPARRTPRRMRHFDVPLVVEAEEEPEHGMTAVEVTASDQPGLLSKIARAFLAVGVRVHSARVATIGERVDDVFFITDSGNRPVDDETVQAIERELAHRISNPGAS